MKMHIALAALLIAGVPSLAAAQSSTPAPGTAAPVPAPMTSAPASNTTGTTSTQPNYQPPPAAHSGDTGLSYGPGSANGDPIIVKRKP